MSPRAGHKAPPYTRRVHSKLPDPIRACIAATAAASMLALAACDRKKESPLGGSPADTNAERSGTDSATSASGGPDTSAMGPMVLEKINENPSIDGKATLVEFRQKSISTQALGDSLKSAVVEFEGIVTFSGDVQWSWQGPTKAGERAKFEARAEYVNQGKGWELVQPIGIYPL